MFRFSKPFPNVILMALESSPELAIGVGYLNQDDSNTWNVRVFWNGVNKLKRSTIRPIDDLISLAIDVYLD